MNIQLRKLHVLIQHFMILQLRHTTFIAKSLKEIHSGRETGLIDTGPLLNELWRSNKVQGLPSLSLFRNEFNRFNNTGARMLDSIYHMT